MCSVLGFGSLWSAWPQPPVGEWGPCMGGSWVVVSWCRAHSGVVVVVVDAGGTMCACDFSCSSPFQADTAGQLGRLLCDFEATLGSTSAQ